ncbi:MAG: hypothetical protein EOM20_20895 [Spartobacteria bacterium]|nr:hypothetical protein [Spartobacteria bacterium]
MTLDIAGATAGTVASADKILFADADDSDNVKRTTAGAIAALAPVTAIGSIGGGTQDIDLSTGVRSFSGTVDTSTTTFTFSNPKAIGNEDIFTLRLTNGGSQTVNWPASVDWAGGTAPDLTAAGVDELIFKTIDGGTNWTGAAILDVQ